MFFYPDYGSLDKSHQLLFSSVKENGAQVVQHAVERLLGRVLAKAGLFSVECFRSGEQRPSPSVWFAMPVGGIHKVLGDDVAGQSDQTRVVQG